MQGSEEIWGSLKSPQLPGTQWSPFLQQSLENQPFSFSSSLLGFSPC